MDSQLLGKVRKAPENYVRPDDVGTVFAEAKAGRRSFIRGAFAAATAAAAETTTAAGAAADLFCETPSGVSFFISVRAPREAVFWADGSCA